MWQSQAFAGALSFGASVPEEFGTAPWAWLSCAQRAGVAARAAPLRRKFRRFIAVGCMERPPDSGAVRVRDEISLAPARRSSPHSTPRRPPMSSILDRPGCMPPFRPTPCYVRPRLLYLPRPLMVNRRHCLMSLLLASLCVAAGGRAEGPPHVWVTMKSEVVYAADGSVTGVRHAWTFDDMFSAFATQGLDAKKKGEFTREELAPLAEVNVTSLKEFDFFTHAKADGKKMTFAEPTDYYLEYKDNVLTLNFTLPLKTPAKSKSLQLDIYDPTYFVDFSFAEKEPVALKGAPATCKFAVARPNDPASGKQVGEA